MYSQADRPVNYLFLKANEIWKRLLNKIAKSRAGQVDWITNMPIQSNTPFCNEWTMSYQFIMLKWISFYATMCVNIWQSSIEPMSQSTLRYLDRQSTLTTIIESGFGYLTCLNNDHCLRYTYVWVKLPLTNYKTVKLFNQWLGFESANRKLNKQHLASSCCKIDTSTQFLKTTLVEKLSDCWRLMRSRKIINLLFCGILLIYYAKVFLAWLFGSTSIL